MHPALLINAPKMTFLLYYGPCAMLLALAVIVMIKAVVLWSLGWADYCTTLKQAGEASATSIGALISLMVISRSTWLLSIFQEPSPYGLLTLFVYCLVVEGLMLCRQRGNHARGEVLLAAISMTMTSFLILAAPLAYQFSRYWITKQGLGWMYALLVILPSLMALETLILVLLRGGTSFARAVIEAFLANVASTFSLLMIGYASTQIPTHWFIGLHANFMIVFVLGFILLFAIKATVLRLLRWNRGKALLRAAFIPNAFSYCLLIAPLLQFMLRDLINAALS